MRSTVKFLVLSTAVIGWLSMASHRADAVVTITLSNQTGAPGDTVPVTATLSTGTDMVAGTQNDITIPAGLSIGLNSDQSPDCAVNPDIHKGATSFAYLPAGCTPGTDCTGVRAIVLSLTSTAAIADGSVLYTCQVGIGADASGTLTLDNTNANASTPGGVQLPTTGVAGLVTVTGGAADATIHVGTATGEAGTTATFDVTLETGAMVAGSQNDIAFDADTQIPLNSEDNPDCTVNPDIHKGATSFAYLPAGCTVGQTCTGIRAIVLSLTSTAAIPDGSRLYSCNVAIAATATGSHPLTCSNANASDPNGVMLTTACTSGTVMVGGVTPTTPSVTATATSTGNVTVPTATATTAGPTRTSTTIPTNPTTTVTATRTIGTPSTTTATPTVTRTSGVSTPTSKPTARTLEDDGCAVVSPTDASAGWLLLLPAAMLLWVRRRTR